MAAAVGHPRRLDKIARGSAKGVIFAGTATNREESPIGGAPGHVARTLFSLLFLQTSKRLGTRLLGSLLGFSASSFPFVLLLPTITTTRPTPGSLSLDPDGVDAANRAIPRICEMHLCPR